MASFNEKTATNEELLQALANAKATQSCGGHYKGQMNEMYESIYREELIKRNVPIPPVEELYKKGKFNGVGSF